jgi:hypothetical protein
VAQQFGNVLPALTQRRNLDADDVQTVQQILAEMTRLHAAFQVLMGGRNDPYIHLHRCLAAHPVELALGEHAQQPRLQRRGHVADFIEEQRAAVRLFEAAAPQRIGAGECAFFVAEQLGLQEVGGERRRVERDECLAGARAVSMQRVRHQFLSRAGFTGDEHGHARARQPADGAKHLLHGCRLAQQFRDAAPCGVDVGGHRRLLRRAPHQIDRFVDVKGFRQILERTSLVGRDGGIQIRVGGHHDHRQTRPGHLDLLEQVQTTAPGHADVGHQDVGRIGAQRGERVVRAFERLRQHSAALQGLLEHPANRCVVVHQPHL